MIAMINRLDHRYQFYSTGKVERRGAWGGEERGEGRSVCDWTTLYPNIYQSPAEYLRALFLDQHYFLIYINQLPNILKYFSTILYADDTNLFYNSKTLSQEILDVLNNDLGTFYKWTAANKLTLNLSNPRICC